jgi:outer membrane protein TolC
MARFRFGWRALGALGCLITAPVPMPLHGQQAPADTLSAAQAVALALATNPFIRAAEQSGVAARERVAAAGALPDPRLTLGLMNRMTSDLGATGDPMTMDQVALSQVIPFPGKLGLARRAARHAADAAEASADAARRTLATDVQDRYYDLAYMDRALAVMARTRALLETFRDVATSLYATGSGRQADALRAQVEVASIDEQIVRLGEQRTADAARFNALLARPAGTPVGPLRLPDALSDLPPADSLVARAAATHPAVQAASARAAAADASSAVARRDLLPDLEIGLAYQHRPAFPSMMSLMVAVDLPLFARARQLPARREMAALAAGARDDLAELRNELAAQVIAARARAERALTLRRLFASDILPQARAAVTSALANYRVGAVDFATLVDDQLTVNRYEIETVRLLADYHEAAAELAALTGGTP